MTNFLCEKIVSNVQQWKPETSWKTVALLIDNSDLDEDDGMV